MGRKFYDSDFPELVRQLKRLNDNLEKPKESPMHEALRLDKDAKELLTSKETGFEEDLKAEDAYKRRLYNDTPITITRYTPEQAKKIEIDDDFFENRISHSTTIETKVISVLEVLLPNCGKLYISEYENGKFWTVAGQTDEWGTLDQCIKLLKEEFL
jgi:hypothetical protein